MPFYSNQIRPILRCHTATSAAPRTARSFKFRFGILKFHRTTHLDFVAKALAQTPPAAEILSRIFKIPRRCFQTLCRLPLDTATLKFNQT